MITQKLKSIKDDLFVPAKPHLVCVKNDDEFICYLSTKKLRDSLELSRSTSIRSLRNEVRKFLSEIYKDEVVNKAMKGLR